MKALKSLLIVIPVVLTIVISSCYYDYGITSDNYDLVGTFYNPNYNFNNVTKYYFVDSVFHAGSQPITRQYDNHIKTTIKNNLNQLGWTQVTDTSGTGVVVVAPVVTTGTVTYVEGDDYCWYDYWGYPYCDSYYTSYTFTTGTVAILLSDLKVREGSKIPIQWNATINGLTGSGTGNVNDRITTTINKAFAQSPYLH